VPKESAGAAMRLPHTREGRSSNAKLRGAGPLTLRRGTKPAQVANNAARVLQITRLLHSGLAVAPSAPNRHCEMA
jgi:hypothetical protein